MFRNLFLSAIVSIGMSSCTVMVMAAAPLGVSSLTPSPAVAAPAR